MWYHNLVIPYHSLAWACGSHGAWQAAAYCHVFITGKKGKATSQMGGLCHCRSEGAWEGNGRLHVSLGVLDEEVVGAYASRAGKQSAAEAIREEGKA